MGFTYIPRYEGPRTRSQVHQTVGEATFVVGNAKCIGNDRRKITDDLVHLAPVEQGTQVHLYNRWNSRTFTSAYVRYIISVVFLRNVFFAMNEIIQ